MGIALAYGLKGDTRIKQEFLRKVLAVEDASAEAHFHMALACNELGERDRAVTHARRALDLDPTYARRILERVREFVPGDAARDLAGRLLERMRRGTADPADAEALARDFVRLMAPGSLSAPSPAPTGAQDLGRFLEDARVRRRLEASLRPADLAALRRIAQDCDQDANLDEARRDLRRGAGTK
jgi:tetratricopeptide (TPR) repeat protein